MRAGPGRARRSLDGDGKSTREVMLSAIQTTSKETTLQEHAAAEHGSAHDIPAESPKFRHPHKVMLGLYIGAFLGMLSETLMNIALPDLMDEFSVSSGTAQWMVVGYMLAIGVALPAMYAAIMRVFPPSRLGAASSVAGLVIMFAPVVGPTVAGALIGALSWRAIFIMFAVVAVVAIACTAAFFVTPIERTRPAVDVASILASVVGFGCLVAGVSLISDMGFCALVIALLVE